MGTTQLFLVHHGATEASLAQPPRLQGRRHDAPLARLGIRQAEATRDFLAIRPIDRCYCSSLLRARQTARILCAPHGILPVPLDELAECDVGRWEGMDWQAVRLLDAEGVRRFDAEPGFGYPGGESFADSQERMDRAMEAILERHEGRTVLVVGHRLANCAWLAGLLGMGPKEARKVDLDHCGISVVTRRAGRTAVSTLNAAFHLQGVAA